MFKYGIVAANEIRSNSCFHYDVMRSDFGIWKIDWMMTDTSEQCASIFSRVLVSHAVGRLGEELLCPLCYDGTMKAAVMTTTGRMCGPKSS